MIWDTFAFNADDIRYSCSDVASWHGSAWLWRMEVDQAILLGIWFSRFGERCLFDFWASNLVGSVLSDMKKSWAFLQVCFATEHRVTRGNIKLSGRELADVEKVLRLPKEDRHLGKLRPLFRKYVEKVSKKGGTSTKKGKTPMLVPVNDILFHKGAHKHWVRPAPRPKSQEEVLKITASKRAEAEAIGCAAAIVTGEERRLLPPLPTIEPIFPPTMKSTDQEGDPSSTRRRKYKEEPSSFQYVNNCLAGRRSTIDELGKPLDENESDRDQMMRLSSYVMTEYDNRLLEVERYKAKFKENNQLVNDAKKTSKALAEAIRLKDQHFESLKRRNVSELKRSIPTERDTAVQEFLGSQAFQDAFKPHCIRARYDNGSIIQKYRDEMDEYRQRGEAFILVVDPSNEDDSDNKASVSEQSQKSEDGFGGNGNVVETQTQRLYNVSLLVIVLQVISIPWMAKGLAIGAPQLFWTQNIACSSSTGTTASVPKASENGVSPVEVRYEVRNGCQGFYFSPLCEVVNCNDCIMNLAISCRYWADQIKSPLGEGPRADHRSVRHRKYGRLKPRL
ncbi:hypothetical protein D8674_028761 [Pyrus ussuriensis x Pyrus communis]|uniref:GRIP domain-containing protein RUD3-like n=1 Tax=Pyrus ussuriensis x Pyrus communis TaxID=2448454 RepID=A0A5N5IAP1_9ROSA|nr:hypothetical protein D8674_028761 [Pyrus ussuriensis x Pyrus communis]